MKFVENHPSRDNRLKLSGFSNLAKSLSFNIYDVCYVDTPAARREYLEYIEDKYNSCRLLEILREATKILETRILSLSSQDYDPMGASATVLMAEDPPGQAYLAHLDKSHLAAHTYVESDFSLGAVVFRMDVDVSTCGEITPLKLMDFMIGSFKPEIAAIDYRVRGFARNVEGGKIFLDHEISSIQDFIDKNILKNYKAVDVNFSGENMFHTKMAVENVCLERSLFGSASENRSVGELAVIRNALENEIGEIFYSKAHFT